MAMGSEMACAYAALILADDGIKVSVDGIKSILKAADVHVESVWPEIFVNALESVNIGELVTNIGGGFGAGSVAAAPAAVEAPAESAKPAEKKEEKKEESESDEELGPKCNQMISRKVDYVKLCVVSLFENG
ncbi:60s Acidic ribosomal protein [Trichuris suis]|nr:60s Acidic ribosomal protein [Trichuris suis]